ncbi:c-type cytochrome [Gluconobacter wancherniae]|uniref:Cytochrome c n=1 Tax=Gluconobacter wancherniae NBRC 103581 TaxID=656744 RepID=A0A511AY13_9PROT|nr:cytochrome c [Gluconobacter wancherniae]MBF0853225.1 cytochrome c [Gluconobacter wancherniae]GBD56050.1 cytochrome c [Gluconobacter wancherniae NBRC 103581]GBR63104.1 gluconate 2-dehydrogenase, cytochrome c subunit [Gluconobacter wancherniae NBRC 103581]GEK93046.1 cytochrome c [Gluconobacter wancherniae NBRC 103581]
MNNRLKKALTVLAPTAVVLTAGVTWFVSRTPASHFDSVISPDLSPALVSRGEYISRLSDCVACHSVPDGAAYTGGLKMVTPMGAIFATNITPDQTTGIGTYTLADFDRAIRAGVAKDGRRLYPAMPYPSYAKLSNEDVRALYAYFMKGVPAVHRENKKSTIPWPLNMRWPLSFWNELFVPAGQYVQDAARDKQWNRGAYLVETAGHCGACHTPRSLAFNEKGMNSHNSQFLSGALIDHWFAPSLRNDPNTGLGRWNEQDIFDFLKTGRNSHAVVFGSMTEAFNNSTQFFSDADLKAVAHYLKSLQRNASHTVQPWQYVPTTAEALEPNQRKTPSGAQTYMAKCSFCHGTDGRGQSVWIPPLAGAASSLTADTSSQINITLNGSGRVVANGMPDAYRMPSYRSQLSDQQAADVLTFIRSSWGNRKTVISPNDVKNIRKRTTPAQIFPVILKTE